MKLASDRGGSLIENFGPCYASLPEMELSTAFGRGHPAISALILTELRKLLVQSFSDTKKRRGSTMAALSDV